uniref:Uncharacterized protein n=1 Tax=Siphoviridae sp. ctrEg9 TaxID=2825688 RepID=A0A8S5PHY2_9CAUD|nr:MAG TPA: hypothetical protein [Siphoviridae sp. ctrEg9]
MPGARRRGCGREAGHLRRGSPSSSPRRAVRRCRSSGLRFSATPCGCTSSREVTSLGGVLCHEAVAQVLRELLGGAQNAQIAAGESAAAARRVAGEARSLLQKARCGGIMGVHLLILSGSCLREVAASWGLFVRGVSAGSSGLTRVQEVRFADPCAPRSDPNRGDVASSDPAADCARIDFCEGCGFALCKKVVAVVADLVHNIDREILEGEDLPISGAGNQCRVHV